jgi:hypothetical protein
MHVDVFGVCSVGGNAVAAGQTHSERFILSDGNVGEDLDGQLPSRLSAEFDFDLNWKDLY